MYFGGVLLKPGHPGPSRTPFPTGLPGPAPLTSKRHPKQAYRHPGTTGVVERALDDLLELYGAPRMTFHW
ncbi:hypothetical protein CDL15_Pgr023994 [Punica granatum]|uniref:Uncharacterized protein n=1 Tax=Punica granatum TaxID=22663 RepID=A0A218XU76_PUNGR|nr:hypothetical protein CDL15_Pgr023994 [Punica granatum]PKI69592.1 hypothetical protein CRG98_010005 [Punica granatum]